MKKKTTSKTTPRSTPKQAQKSKPFPTPKQTPKTTSKQTPKPMPRPTLEDANIEDHSSSSSTEFDILDPSHRAQLKSSSSSRTKTTTTSSDRISVQVARDSSARPNQPAGRRSVNVSGNVTERRPRKQSNPRKSKSKIDKEIRFQRSSVNNLIPKAPFHR